MASLSPWRSSRGLPPDTSISSAVLLSVRPWRSQVSLIRESWSFGETKESSRPGLLPRPLRLETRMMPIAVRAAITVIITHRVGAWIEVEDDRFPAQVGELDLLPAAVRQAEVGCFVSLAEHAYSSSSRGTPCGRSSSS